MQPNPPPVPNTLPAVWPLVVEDMHARHALGVERYGTPLQPFNGRKPLVDAYEEVLDLAVYLRQEIEERKRMPEIQRLSAEIAELHLKVRAHREGQEMDNVLQGYETLGGPQGYVSGEGAQKTVDHIRDSGVVKDSRVMSAAGEEGIHARCIRLERSLEVSRLQRAALEQDRERMAKERDEAREAYKIEQSSRVDLERDYRARWERVTARLGEERTARDNTEQHVKALEAALAFYVKAEA